MPDNTFINAPLSSPSATAGGTARGADVATFADWKEEVRSAPPPVVKRRSVGQQLGDLVRHAIVPGLLLSAVPLGVIAAWRTVFPPTATVCGRLLDPAGQPVMGARVFAVSDPGLETVTSQAGAFELRGLRLGRQSVVAVLEDLGQEYTVEGLQGNELREAGDLQYQVPPLWVRLSPGAGARPQSGAR